MQEHQLLDSETKERDGIIVQLRETIQEIQALTLAEQKYMKRELKAKESTQKMHHVSKEQEFEKQMEHLRMEIEAEQKVHSVIVDYLTRRRLHLETQIEVWMEKHERETERKAVELEQLKQARSMDCDVFEDLAVKYEDLERLVEEDKAQRDREINTRLTARDLELKTKSALIIQRLFRQKKKKTASAASKQSAKKKKKKKKK